LLGNRRQLRGVPWAGEPAREARRVEFALLGSAAWVGAPPAEVGEQPTRDRDLCAVPRAAGGTGDHELSTRRATRRLLSHRPARGGALPRRWADTGRGVRRRIIYAK